MLRNIISKATTAKKFGKPIFSTSQRFCRSKAQSNSFASRVWNKKPCRIIVNVAAFHTGLLIGAAVVSPEPLSILKGMYRFVSCFAVTSVIALDYKFSLRKLEKEQYEKALHEVHQRSAKRLLALFRYNKGIFIKFGQHLAALDYLLPDEYTSTMKVLQSAAPDMEFNKIESVFIEEYGKSPHEMFVCYYIFGFGGFLTFFFIVLMNLMKFLLLLLH